MIITHFIFDICIVVLLIAIYRFQRVYVKVEPVLETALHICVLTLHLQVSSFLFFV